MKLFGKISLLAPLLLVLACQQNPELAAEVLKPLELSAQVDNAKPATNDTITYTVTVNMDERLQMDVPQFGANIAGLRVTDAGHGETRKVAGRQVTNYWYKLRADLSGVYLLPAIKLSYPQPDWYQGDSNSDLTAETAEIFLDVGSRVSDGSSMALRDLKDLPHVSATVQWWWILTGVVILLIIAVVLLIRRRQQEELLVQRPAHEIAYDGLAGLVDVPLNDEASQRNFFFQLSAVLREYLENRFAVNATDMTTEEVSVALRGVVALDDQHRRVALNLLRSYDQVKYAGLLLERDNGNADVSEVKRFVDDTLEVTADSAVEED